VNSFGPEYLTADYVKRYAWDARKMSVIVSHHGHFPENPKWPPSVSYIIVTYLINIYIVMFMFCYWYKWDITV